MLRVSGDTGAGDVHVPAAVFLVRPEQLDLHIRLGVVQATEVVGVDDTHVALTGVDGLQQGGVIGKDRSGQIGQPALNHFGGLLFTNGFEHGGNQRLVVDRKSVV